jgi:UDP-N-acetylmuramoyl-tripeptide--D-alanyl-D-alanine ligase
MIPVSIEWICKNVDGQLFADNTGDTSVSQELKNQSIISGVSTDTRSIKTGDLFIALVGPNFDGHAYLAAAKEKGASAAIVSKADATLSDLIQIVVGDTRLALGALGAAVKEEVSPKTIGITGSSGKTTVKEMVYAILSQRGKVLATKGNFNNDIGVPLTLLELKAEHDFAVIEMGANHQGEIEYTCSLVKPDVATIINAAPAHIEGFGSLFGVARAKSEIISGLKDDAVAILNTDSQFYDFWKGKSATQQILTFSYESDKGDFSAKNIAINAEGCAEFELISPIGVAAIRLRVPGLHNVGNAVLSAALAISAGANLADVKNGLFAMQSVSGRLNVKHAHPRVKILDDTYNANVGSVKAAIDLLATFDGFRVFIFGDMGELGDQAPMYHSQVGEYAAQNNIDALISCGPLSAHASSAMQNNGMACANPSAGFEALMQLIAPILHPVPEYAAPILEIQTTPKNNAVDQKPNITILVKGSRSARMEKVVDAIMAFNFSLQEGKDNNNNNNEEPEVC